MVGDPGRRIDGHVDRDKGVALSHEGHELRDDLAAVIILVVKTVTLYQ
ncbi:hypothetical protein K1W69_02000 [Hoeflea sp. WL0058]|uniref:Uncharacterized protein n=1 Tax=Flavimaribacter sediminis TaxID=2865987 RepID=A0AAE2ZMB9_9HYPH|nr:hypothetical protein [Flavimaribacter sediminis]MBW8635942.1 hypothetical protein [Flavimaribacter sediminis]